MSCVRRRSARMSSPLRSPFSSREKMGASASAYASAAVGSISSGTFRPPITTSCSSEAACSSSVARISPATRPRRASSMRRSAVTGTFTRGATKSYAFSSIAAAAAGVLRVVELGPGEHEELARPGGARDHLLVQDGECALWVVAEALHETAALKSDPARYARLPGRELAARELLMDEARIHVPHR